MSFRSVNYYKPMIAAATTKEELSKISYSAFMEDSSPLHKKNTMSNRVDALCMLREVELGFLPNDPKYVAALQRQVRTGKSTISH